MEFITTSIKDLYLVKPFVSRDERGAFIKDYSEEEFSKANINHQLKEVFYTISKQGVMRGMHFQKKKQQPKLVRCIKGHIIDIILDLRIDSPTFKQWITVELSDTNNLEVYIPSGCAHGYIVIEDSIVSYKCGEKYYPEYDSGISYKDPVINEAIQQGYKKLQQYLYNHTDAKFNEVDEFELIVSEKDKNLQSFKYFLDNYEKEF